MGNSYSFCFSGPCRNTTPVSMNWKLQAIIKALNCILTLSKMKIHNHRCVKCWWFFSKLTASLGNLQPPKAALLLWNPFSLPPVGISFQRMFSIACLVTRSTKLAFFTTGLAPVQVLQKLVYNKAQVCFSNGNNQKQCILHRPRALYWLWLDKGYYDYEPRKMASRSTVTLMPWLWKHMEAHANRTQGVLLVQYQYCLGGIFMLPAFLWHFAFIKPEQFDCVDTANLGSAGFKYFQIFPIYTRIEGCAKPDRRNQLYSVIKAAMSGIGLSLTGLESKHGR